MRRAVRVLLAAFSLAALSAGPAGARDLERLPQGHILNVCIGNPEARAALGAEAPELARRCGRGDEWDLILMGNREYCLVNRRLADKDRPSVLATESRFTYDCGRQGWRIEQSGAASDRDEWCLRRTGRPSFYLAASGGILVAQTSCTRNGIWKLDR